MARGIKIYVMINLTLINKLGMKYNKNPKIFIGLGDTCGYYSNLEKGFIDNHVKCEFVNAFPMRDYKRICRSSSYIGRVVE